ncbi:MAG TPA: hypothetical protein VG714_02300 [Acidobacteriaceae bacterium]|nr:hypothetical protein [Acidobacteriaceae bacterium]
MADRLYLSLWYPNFRLEALPGALTGVMRQFAVIGGRRVIAASAYPINFTESPTYQRLYNEAGSDPRLPAEMDPDAATADAAIEAAVAEATEQLHDDMAYEFEMRWQLWAAEPPDPTRAGLGLAPSLDDSDAESESEQDEAGNPIDPDSPWRLRTHTVRILGFGPLFDVAGYEQNGHILVDFGLDTPWLLDTPLDPDDDSGDTEPLDDDAQLHIQQNIEKLLAFTLLVEKNCGISSRLLWTESGEPLAEKLIARLQRVN